MFGSYKRESGMWAQGGMNVDVGTLSSVRLGLRRLGRHVDRDPNPNPDPSVSS